MQALNVIIAHGDCVVAESLAAALHSHFQNISVARSSEELRALLHRMHPDAAVVDLETVELDEVADLCHKYALPVVATHRIPDDKIWTEALAVGATDCCENSDVRNIVGAISRSVHSRYRYASAA